MTLRLAATTTDPLSVTLQDRDTGATLTLTGDAAREALEAAGSQFPHAQQAAWRDLWAAHGRNARKAEW
jgi:hypothetical protein